MKASQSSGSSSQHHFFSSIGLLSSASAALTTLLVVVLSTSLVWLAVATAGGDDDGDGDTANTCESSLSGRPRFHPQDDSLILYSFDSLTSSQDEAKRIAETFTGDDRRDDDNHGDPTTASAASAAAAIDGQIRSFVVTTREQTNGRGTNGRIWMGQRGNVFCTIGIRQQDWVAAASNIPLTLLPLKIGSLVAQSVQRLVDECYYESSSSSSRSSNKYDAPLVTVKWPNDVLVNEQKISGVLIESSSNGWFLIGIGINLAYAPEVAQSGPNRGRPATSLSDLCPATAAIREKEAEELGIALAFDLHSFLIEMGTGMVTSEQVLQDWKQWIDWDMELVMRDTPGQERVRLVGVLPDGRVQVQNVQDDRIRTLVSDYFL